MELRSQTRRICLDKELPAIDDRPRATFSFRQFNLAPIAEAYRAEPDTPCSARQFSGLFRNSDEDLPGGIVKNGRFGACDRKRFLLLR
jgi:hypothetical protein